MRRNLYHIGFLVARSSHCRNDKVLEINKLIYLKVKSVTVHPLLKSPCSTLTLKGNKAISALSPFRDGEKRAEIADFD